MMPASPLQQPRRHVLATDLDGTLIPLQGNAQNRIDLKTLSAQLEEHGVTLVFVTGRHFESVEKAMAEFDLPTPQWVICDVGTSIFQQDSSGAYSPSESYYHHQDEIISTLPIAELRELLQPVDRLRLQEPEKQGRFKLSFYADADQLDNLTLRVEELLREKKAPYSIVHSVDPFNGDGLIDLLPANVSKAYALEWWANEIGLDDEQILFAGDSGNDLAALTSGHCAIVVGNADRQLAKRVEADHREAGWQNRLYLARGHATSGVLEGCHWFRLAERNEPAPHRLGATPLSHNETYFCVWAPRRQTVSVELFGNTETSRHRLSREDDGYFVGTVSNCGPNARYQYVLDEQTPRPDPASSFQPDGVHGVSQVVDPRSFTWTDLAWKGIEKRDLVIYELHLGTFTQKGTFRSAIEQLPRLLKLGITAIELMPVAQSPGKWNWGYDGVNLFAVRNTYGTPDDFKALVDACHRVGLSVFLDVVYNHLGPEGNYLSEFGPYFSDKHRTPWGEAFNFDGPQSADVRHFIVENAIYWLEEFHLDGLRLDAVHLMLDDSRPTILAEIRKAVTEFSNTIERNVHLIAEANVFDSELVNSEQNGPSYDAIWCDCLMHSIYTHALPKLQLTHREFRGATDMAEALQHGYVYAGCNSARVSAQERAELHIEDDQRQYVSSLVMALQTHDSVGNHPHGKRIHQLTSKAFQRAAAGLVLMYPSIPMIFMGEESAVDAPFPFFVDFEDAQLIEAVDMGRAREYPQHLWDGALSPSNPEAFLQAKCHCSDQHDEEMFAWYQSVIALHKTGVSEGWLAPDRITSAYDADHNLFSLHFCHPSGEIMVRARLTPVEEKNAVPLEIALEGTLLLSSESGTQPTSGHMLLHPNHTVISRSEAIA